MVSQHPSAQTRAREADRAEEDSIKPPLHWPPRNVCTVLCVLYFAIHTAEPCLPTCFSTVSSPLTFPSPIIGRGKFTSDYLPYLYLGKTVIPRNFQDVVLTPSPQDSAPKTQLPLPARPERDRTVCSFPLLSARDWRRCGELIYVPGAPARDWHGARVEDGLSHV